MNMKMHATFGLPMRAAVAAGIVAALLLGLVPSLVGPARAGEAPGAASAPEANENAGPRFHVMGSFGDGIDIDYGVDGLAFDIWSQSRGITGLTDPGDGLPNLTVVDACSINGQFWAFADGDLTDYEVTITDTVTGLSKTYVPPSDSSAGADGDPLAFLDTQAFGTCAGDDEPRKVPRKISGQATQTQVAGRNSCGEGFKSKFIIDRKKETFVFDFGRGLKVNLELAGSDPETQSAVFRDRNPNFDTVVPLWLEGNELTGALIEGPDASFSDELVMSLLGANPEAGDLAAWIEPLTSMRDACAWTTETRFKKKTRRSVQSFWERFVGAPAEDVLDEETKEAIDAALGNEDRFKVDTDWTTPVAAGSVRSAVTPLVRDSGVFWFFDPDNLEVLVKVLDGCALNGNFWVFAAATTNVEYTLTVTDTPSGVSRTYGNELGQRPLAITDTQAFATCP